MPRLGARKVADFKAVGTAPSINKTPAGPSVVPVAYPVQHDLSNSVSSASTVRFNGDPAHKLNATTQSSTLGDAPGTAGGVRSGTVGGQVKPTGASATVKVEGKPLVRDGDTCTLNGGNCPGVYVAGGGPGGKVEAGRPKRDADPPAKLTQPEQKAWYQKVGDWVGEQAHNAGQAIVHPVEGLKGAAKGIGNIPGDLWNLVALGATAQAGGDMMNSAAMMEAFGGGNSADSKAAFELGQQMATKPGAYAPTVGTAFPMSNAAQEGGDLIATLIPTPKGLVEGVGKVGAKMAGKEAAKLTEKEAAKLTAKEAEKAAAKKVEEESAKVAKKEGGKAPEGPGDGAKIKPKKLEEHTPPCFHPYDKPGFKKLSPQGQRKYLEEYSKQLAGQQEAINSMTASQFKAARDAFSAAGRNPVADAAQSAMRTTFEADLKKSLTTSLAKGGKMSVVEASVEAAKQTKTLMEKLAALHEPDMVAGGWLKPNPTSMGRTDVNSSIGASWNQGGRIAGMEGEATKAIGAGNGGAQMNVKLEVCRGKGLK